MTKRIGDNTIFIYNTLFPLRQELILCQAPFSSPIRVEGAPCGGDPPQILSTHDADRRRGPVLKKKNLPKSRHDEEVVLYTCRSMGFRMPRFYENPFSCGKTGFPVLDSRGQPPDAKCRGDAVQGSEAMWNGVSSKPVASLVFRVPVVTAHPLPLNGVRVAEAEKILP